MGNASSSKKIPLIFLPGLSGTANDGLALIEGIKDRPVLCLSMRGRGGSECHSSEYSPMAHAKDIEEALNLLEIPEAHFLSYSFSTVYAFEFLKSSPQRVSSLMIGDFPPEVKSFQPGWSKTFFKQTIASKPVSDSISSKALSGIEAQTPAQDYRPLVQKAQISISLLKADSKGSFPSLVNQKNLAFMRACLMFKSNTFPRHLTSSGLMQKKAT